MAKLNYAKARERDRMHAHGAETIGGEVFSFGSFGGGRSRNKTAARAELEKVMSEITRTIRCACGHQVSIALPRHTAGKKLRCRRCGAIQPERA